MTTPPFGGDTEVETGTPPFDLESGIEVNVLDFPNANEYLQDLLDGQFEFPAEDEGGISVYLVDTAEIKIETNSYEQARNRALEEIGEIDPATRKPFIGRIGIGKDRTVGFTTTVNGVFKRFRIDYDPLKGPHINVEVGKGASREKFAIKFPGTETDVDRILNEFN